jgi:hypothetical protein
MKGKRFLKGCTDLTAPTCTSGREAGAVVSGHDTNTFCELALLLTLVFNSSGYRGLFPGGKAAGA